MEGKLKRGRNWVRIENKLVEHKKGWRVSARVQNPTWCVRKLVNKKKRGKVEEDHLHVCHYTEREREGLGSSILNI